MKITVEPQPREFIGRQAPEARRKLRELLHDVERGKVHPEPLERELDGFYKLKWEDYRLILQHASSADGPFLRVVFAEKRGLVYEIYKGLLGLN